MKILQLIRKSGGAITAFTAAILLAICAANWMGFDFRLVDRSLIGDKADSVANSWAIYQATDNLLHRPTDLGYSTIFYGTKASFASTIAPYGIAVFIFPLYFLSGWNLYLAYNLYWLVTFGLIAWGMYTLTRVIFHASKGAAVLAGLMVAFAQFRLSEFIQVESMSTQFYIWGIVFLFLFILQRRWQWAVAYGAAFWFTFFTSGYQGIYFLITSAIVLIYFLVKYPRLNTHQFRIRFFATALITALVCIPFITYRMENESFRLGTNYPGLTFYSAHLEDWFVGVSQIYSGTVKSAGPEAVFIGFTPLILSAIAWYRRKTQAEPIETTSTVSISTQDIVILFLIITATGYLLSLGPVLQIEDHAVLPLPYLFLIQFPAFSWMRVPARFIYMAIVGTAALSAYALTTFRTSIWYRVILALVTVCLFIELTPSSGSPEKIILRAQAPTSIAPMQSWIWDDNSIPPVYKWLKHQPSETVVFHFPNSSSAVFNYLWYERYHNQPMINGYGSFHPFGYNDVKWNMFPDQNSLDYIRSHGAQYVLLHNDLLSSEEQAAFQQRLSAYPNTFQFVQNLGMVDVYKLTTP